MYLLVKRNLRQPVHLADHDFHLISTQVTKVKDAHDMCVFKLTGSCQDFLCRKKTQKTHILNIKCKRCMCRQMLPEWTLSPPQWLPGLGRVSSLLLAVLLRGQRKPDERQDSIVLPCGSWGRPTACGSLELTTGIYTASTAICLLMPAREIKTEKKAKWEFISKCIYFFTPTTTR